MSPHEDSRVSHGNSQVLMRKLIEENNPRDFFDLCKGNAYFCRFFFFLQVKQPKTLKFKSLREAIAEPGEVGFCCAMVLSFLLCLAYYVWHSNLFRQCRSLFPLMCR